MPKKSCQMKLCLLYKIVIQKCSCINKLMIHTTGTERPKFVPVGTIEFCLLCGILLYASQKHAVTRQVNVVGRKSTIGSLDLTMATRFLFFKFSPRNLYSSSLWITRCVQHILCKKGFYQFAMADFQPQKYCSRFRSPSQI